MIVYNTDNPRKATMINVLRNTVLTSFTFVSAFCVRDFVVQVISLCTQNHKQYKLVISAITLIVVIIITVVLTATWNT
jgi:hypothetical protein